MIWTPHSPWPLQTRSIICKHCHSNPRVQTNYMILYTVSFTSSYKGVGPGFTASPGFCDFNLFVGPRTLHFREYTRIFSFLIVS